DASPRQRAPGPVRAAGPSATTRPLRQRADRGRGANRAAGPASRLDPPARPASLCAWPAAPTSAITRTDLTNLTRLSLQRRRGGLPVVGVGVGWVVRSGGSCWCWLWAGIGQRN